MTNKKRAALLKHFHEYHARLHGLLQEAQEHIDDVGTIGDDLAGGKDAGMLACFAAYTIHGALSLLREMEALVAAPQDLARRPRKK